MGCVLEDPAIEWGHIYLVCDASILSCQVNCVSVCSYLTIFGHGLLFDAGYYTCVEVIFTLRRQVGFYMMGVYAPTLLIVVLSWLSFWINPDASAARVPLGRVLF